VLKGIGREATYYYHPDHLGSVSVVSNHRGEPYERVEYLPFGEIWIEETDPATGYIPFRFTSKELDEETGLYYYGARYYEPATSRWMSPDPAGFGLINPMDSDGELRADYSVIEALNWYSYVSNNPVMYVDPSGMELKIKGSKDFVRETEKALDMIRSKPKGKELVGKLEDSENVHKIKEAKKADKAESDGNRTKFPRRYKEGDGGTGSVIRFDPEDRTGGKDSEGSEVREPFIGLAHELGHAEAIDEGTQSPPIFKQEEPGTTPPSETNSVRRENEIRSEHGFPLRPSYYSSEGRNNP